ncbi:hypothetical protein SAMD00023353_4000560 [Rosellinia necatrix]|uniref:Uncharacterized protein n=1 Tax=Rosellinia necatrix TaxID=77044 RepID=A0A1S8A9C9_ROSNE|nr:hypothetical protein SAMD00023353_4000560 [Rosellinia necatrix]
MLGSRSLLALVGWCVSVATAVDVVYVTDLTIFSDLGPCAKSAISGVVDYQTVSNCPEDSSALHSCICSKNAGGNQRNVLSSISNSIVYRLRFDGD